MCLRKTLPVWYEESQIVNFLVIGVCSVHSVMRRRQVGLRSKPFEKWKRGGTMGSSSVLPSSATMPKCPRFTHGSPDPRAQRWMIWRSRRTGGFVFRMPRGCRWTRGLETGIAVLRTLMAHRAYIFIRSTTTWIWEGQVVFLFVQLLPFEEWESNKSPTCYR